MRARKIVIHTAARPRLALFPRPLPLCTGQYSDEVLSSDISLSVKSLPLIEF